MQITAGQLRFARLPVLLRRLGEWWLKEFLELFPEQIIEFLSSRSQVSLVIEIDQEGARFELLKGARMLIASERLLLADNALAQIDRFLLSHDFKRKDVDIGLRLPIESVFRRQLLLPAEAIDAIDTIVAQDLAKKTPFKADDIYSDHVVLERDGSNKMIVWQWITRRQYVDQALLPLKIGIEQIAFIVFDGSIGDQPVPFINLRPGALIRNTWSQKTAWVLCCTALILALLAGGLKCRIQQTTIDRLDVQIAATSSKAQQVRALIDQLQVKNNALLRLRIQRSEAPGLIDLWEEASRVLPSHSWLTEFRLVETAGKREEQVTISGFSSAAPSLVAIIDSSPLFFDAALTSPIAFDAAEGRERFALQAKVKMPDTLKEAAR